ncbi:sugar ABC transporter transmembrane protein [Nitratireductor indicus C115]|uniref:Sugar ABC transporter transmembrane protein n=1 Tax=Nitratireductor indicus C115 TaxID=1231190 RepID=K2PPZ4_9HYPH|nr:sugar ABC transporter permease [Nitratireductor indicus]EKF43112.1 sugar ABC transporter transmembrane protein [Nitratireductor indicus C115]SFQ52889.1 multiple sugar transport system permease protein [Nitratireductor indicus]
MARRKLLDLARPSRQHLLGYILLAPAVLLVGLIVVYPLLMSIDLSLQNVKLPRPGQHAPYTVANYSKLFSSQEFWMACWVTLKLVVTVTIGSLIVGVGSALLVNNRFRGRTLARLAIALPWAVPEIIAVVIFARIFDTSFGLLGWLFIKLGLTDRMIAWVSTPGPAFWAVTMTMIWKGFPFVSIMTLAGLQSIPSDYYAAARVDGANAIQRFRWITLPLLMPVLGVTLVLVVLWVFRDFSIIKTLTEGGPLKATQTLSIMTYDQAFGFFNFGYASAVGVVTLVICIVASLLMLGRGSKAMY